MDIKEIIDSAEQTLKDGGLQYLLVAIDTETEQVGALCNASNKMLAQAMANVFEKEERIVLPIAIALKVHTYNKEDEQ